MANIIDTLITDRTQADVDRVHELKEQILRSGVNSLTEEEREEYFSGMKGAYNASDMNRVGEACEFLDGYFAEKLGYHPSGYEKPVTSWDMYSVPTEKDAETYIKNVRIFRDAMGSDISVPPNLDNLDYDGANRIEKALVDAYGLAESVNKNFIMCGIPFCGQAPMIPRVWKDEAAIIPDAKLNPNLRWQNGMTAYTDEVGGTASISMSWDGSGILSIYSSDPSVATAEVEQGGTSVLITLLDVGSAVLTASVSETDEYSAGYAPLVVSSEAQRVLVDIPSQSGTLTYTGNSQSPIWSNYDSGKMTLGGVTSGTNAGSYSVVFSLLPGYRWRDGTLTDKTVQWTIGKASPNLAVDGGVSQSIDVGAALWTGVERNGGGAVTAVSSNDAVATVFVDLSQGINLSVMGVSAGSCVITVRVAETENYTADSVSIALTVANKTVLLPAQSGTLTYSGSSQSPTWSGYDSAKMTLGGTTSGTNAGSYTATFTPKAGYEWSDTGTTAARDVTWSIGEASPNLTVPDNWGDITEGAYLLVTVFWDGDGNIGARASTGTVTVAYYDRPSGYSRNVARFKVTGVSAGSTDVIFSVTGTTNYSTQNATRTATVVARQSPDLRLNMPLPWNMRSGEWRWSRITRNGNGALSARSSNTNVAEASITVTDGSEGLRVDAIGPGSATITVEVAETSAYYGESTAGRVSVTNTKTLNDYTWDEISAISQAGTGDTYFDVGDVKMITLNGTVGTKTYSNVSLGVYILDFNHVDGGTADNNIIWGGFKTALTGGADVALDDAYYSTGKTDGTKAFNMNHWGNYNYGGWKGCDLRYDILGATKTAPSGYGSAPVSGRVGYDAAQAAITSPLADTLMSALPSDFRNVLRLRTHYVDNVGGGTDASANVTTVVDAVSLLAEFEVFGPRSYANQYEQNSQTQMAYYAEGNSAIKYRQSSNEIAAFWAECSPDVFNSSQFCHASPSGSANHSGSTYSYALSPVFKT